MKVHYEPLPGATCCVEPIGLRSLAVDTWLVAAARLLSIAEENDRDILTLCNGCLMSLKEAKHALKSQKIRDRVNEVLAGIGRRYTGKTEIIHLVDLIAKRRTALDELVVKRGTGMRVAIHPGCHLVRPTKLTSYDQSYYTRALSEIASSLGAEVVAEEDWPNCCGGGVSNVNEVLSSKVLDELIDEFATAGANCILTPCPFCFVQFDLRQKRGMPVLYFSEFLALALGASSEEIGLRYHKTKVVV
jgi:heterodisulfide reductase subunit B